MSWQLGLNRSHLQLWRRWLLQWTVFVGVLVVVGWGYGPRLDEVLWVLFVPPLVVVASWGLVNLALIGLWVLRHPDRIDHPRRGLRALLSWPARRLPR
jgi:hypothetical protein